MNDTIVNNKLNIWFFHHYSTPPNSTGLTRPFYLGKYLQKMGHRVSIFTSSYLHFSNKQLINDKSLFFEDDTNEVPFIYVRTHSATGNGFNRIINIIDFSKNLYKVSKKQIKLGNIPDIIIASTPDPFSVIIANLLSKKLSIPSICEVRDLWPESFIEYGYLREGSLLSKILYKGEKWIYKNSDALIFTMAGGKQYLIDKGWTNVIDIEKVYHINNGVDVDEFNENIEKFVIDDDDLNNEENFNIIYTGSVREVNNLDFILETAKIISKKNESIKFIIYGDGTELKNLKEKCRIENISNVIFKGRVEKKYIPNILKQSDINILHNKSSNLNLYGGSQNKLFDYLASGNPIIQTFDGNYSIIKKFDCGYVLNNQSYNKLSDLILNIYNKENELIQKGKNARRASLHYDYKKHAQILNKIIERI